MLANVAVDADAAALECANMCVGDGEGRRWHGQERGGIGRPERIVSGKHSPAFTGQSFDRVSVYC